MGYDNELETRRELLDKYDSLMRQEKSKGIMLRLSFRFNGEYRELSEAYRRFNSFPTRDEDSEQYLHATNKSFSGKLSDFEQLLEKGNE